MWGKIMLYFYFMAAVLLKQLEIYLGCIYSDVMSTLYANSSDNR